MCRGGTGDGSAVERALWRRECRGLVLGMQGVVARPMARFFEPGQIKSTRWDLVGDLRVVEAREKLDGVMVYGVVDAEKSWAELWTRGSTASKGYSSG